MIRIGEIMRERRCSYTEARRAAEQEAKGSFDEQAGSAEPIPTVLFRGEAVWRELNDKERTRTTAINVADVLDAVVRLMRREARQNEKCQR